jgi:hypothetical protein
LGPQIFITTAAHTGQFAADLGSVGSDGMITENVATTPGQTYTFDFWLQKIWATAPMTSPQRSEESRS